MKRVKRFLINFLDAMLTNLVKPGRFAIVIFWTFTTTSFAMDHGIVVNAVYFTGFIISCLAAQILDGQASIKKEVEYSHRAFNKVADYIVGHSDLTVDLVNEIRALRPEVRKGVDNGAN